MPPHREAVNSQAQPQMQAKTQRGADADTGAGAQRSHGAAAVHGAGAASGSLVQGGTDRWGCQSAQFTVHCGSGPSGAVEVLNYVLR